MAAGVEGEQLLHTQCGSPNYCAPEILEPTSSRNGYNGALADTWSVGVILYVLLAGRLPFYDPDPRRLYEAIANSAVQFPTSFPSGAADIVRRLLVKDPPGRMSLEDVQKHPWYVVGMEPPPRRRQRRSRQHPRSSSAASSTRNGTSATVESVSDEPAQATPDDVDPAGAPTRDPGSSGRASPPVGAKPPRQASGSDSPEEVTVLARRNGWGDTQSQERRSPSSDDRDSPLVPNAIAGMNGTPREGESGALPGGTAPPPPLSLNESPLDDRELIQASGPRRATARGAPPGGFISSPASPSMENGSAGQPTLSRSQSADAPWPSRSRVDELRGKHGARLAGKPPLPDDAPFVPIRDLTYTSAEGPTLAVVDDADLDREEKELLFHDNHRASRTSSGPLPDAASGRYSAALSDQDGWDVSKVSDVLAAAVVSGPSSRPSPLAGAAPHLPGASSSQFGNKFATGDTAPHDSAVTETSSRGGERRDSIGSGSGKGERYRSGLRSLQASPGAARQKEGRTVSPPPSLNVGSLPSSSSGHSAPPSLAELSQQGRLNAGGTGVSVAWAQDDSRRGRAGVRSLLGLSGNSEPPSFVTTLPPRECLRTIGTILSNMQLTVFLKKNQNKMKCQVGLLRGLAMWASICYVDSVGGDGLNSVVFRRAREDSSGFDQAHLWKLCNSVHTKYRHAVERSAVRTLEASRDE